MGLNWQNWKLHLEAFLNISRDAMHVHAGVMIFLLACLIFRLRPSQWRVWFIVLFMQLANEALDILAMLHDSGGVSIWPGVKDTINSMILPTLLVLVARRSSLFGARERADVAAQVVQDPQGPDEVAKTCDAVTD